MKNKITSTLLNVLLVVGFTGVMLWLMLKDNINDVKLILEHTHLGWLLFILFIALLCQALVGIILMILSRFSKADYAFHQGFVNALIAAFFHGITPSASGGQIAQIYVFRKQGVDFSDGASILWMDFIVYQSTMVLVVLGLLILRFGYFFTHFSNLFIFVLLAFFINVLIIAGLWIIGRFPKAYHWVTTTGVNLAVRLKMVKDKKKTIEDLNKQLKHFSEEIKHLQSHRQMIIICVILNAVRLLMYYSIPYFCMIALNIEVSLDALIDILALSSYVSMMNTFIPIPGASGGTEATFVLMFSTLMGKVKAASCMILWRFVSYYMIMLIGGITFILFKILVRYQENKKRQGEGLCE